MKLSAILAPLLDAKADHEMIRKTIQAFEDQQIDAIEKRRESDRKRQTEKRSRDVTLRHSDRPLATRVEGSSSTQEISGKEVKKDTSPPARSMRGSRIPDDFKPDIDAAVADGLSRQEAERQALSFCDYWRARPGKEALKLDWPATWRTWFRRRLDERPHATAPPPRNRKPNAVDAMQQIFQERGWNSEPEILRSGNGDDQRVPAEHGGYSGAVVDLRPGAFRRVRSGD